MSAPALTSSARCHDASCAWSMRGEAGECDRKAAAHLKACGRAVSVWTRDEAPMARGKRGAGS